MIYTFIFFTALLLGVTGRTSNLDLGDLSGGLGNMAEEISGRKRIAEVKRIMDKNKRRGGPKDKRAKMPPLFGGRDKASTRARRENARHVKAMHGEPGDMKIPPQEKERRRVNVDEGPPKRKPRRKPSVHEAMSQVQMKRKNAAGPAEVKRKIERRRSGDLPLLESFDITDGQGKVVRLDKKHFPRAKVFFIVNIASRSEYTGQLAELENLYDDLGKYGLEIVAFPSNSFYQEPLEDEEIQSLMKEQYDVSFPVMAKCDVNGPDTTPLYKFLKSHALGGTPKVPEWAPLEVSGLTEFDIQWNFDKFLVYKARGKERVVRFPFDLGPSSLKKHIEQTLQIKNEAIKRDL